MFDGWPIGRLTLQSYLIALQEANRFLELYARAEQERRKYHDEARAFLKDHGPVPVRFVNDDRIYEAKINILGSITLEVKEEKGAWSQ